jgi:TonB family protein
MEHVAAVPSTASDRMSPEALGLAVAVHGLAALAVWWVALQRPATVTVPDPVEITIERPKAAEPPPPPPPPPPRQQQQQVQKAPEPVPIEGLRPPAEITADRRTQKPPSGEAARDIAGPPPDSLEKEVPAPPTDLPPPQIAMAQPEKVQPPPAPTSPPPAEQVAPQPPPPAPPAQRPVPPSPPIIVQPQQPLPTVQPPPTLRPPPPPAPRPPPVVAHPPPALSPHPQAQPSPLSARLQDQPPQIARRDAPQSSSPFVNPADTYNRALVSDNYLWEVIRKLRGYRYMAHGAVSEGVTVVQIVIARDGRLLDVHVVRSSGFAEMDRGVLAGVRAGSPYTPLPASIGGDRATFSLPIMSVPQAQ